MIIFFLYIEKNENILCDLKIVSIFQVGTSIRNRVILLFNHIGQACPIYPCDLEEFHIIACV